MLKKNLTPLYVGEKNFYLQRFGKKITSKSPIPPSPTNVQWSCQPFRGWGMKRIWYLSKCRHVVHQLKWLARVHHVVVFKTKVLHFKIENTTIKDTNEQRKFNGMLSFLFVDKRKLFAMKLSFEEFGLFWSNQGSEDSEETWGKIITRTNHAHCVGQTCAKLYTLFRTDLCEIIYPV